MFIVGLTGGPLTGKSTVLKIFKDNGIAVINADELSKKVLEPGSKGWEEVRKYFGDEVLHPDGQINKLALSEIMSDDPVKRDKYHDISDANIKSAMIRMAISYFFSGHNFIVIEVPYLFESRKIWTSFMYKVITVVADENVQIIRLCQKSGFPEAVAKALITIQMPLKDKAAQSNYIIDNSGDLESVRQQTENIINILKMSKYTLYFRAALLISGVSLMYGAARIVAKKL